MSQHQFTTTRNERVEAAVAAVRKGRGVLVVDDEDRENEGDIIFSAASITHEQMALLIRECSGIRIFGMRIKSIAFTTDVAIIKNINADAIIAVYPFTPQPAISQAVIGISDVPVFVGVGGGITGGDRSVRLAIEAENQGAFGVVVNAPISNEVISRIKEVVDIPVIATIVSDQMDIRSRIEAGADFLNVSGAAATPQIVRRIRAQFPNIPILATGGPNDETILETIHAGANAITYSPPSNGELFAAIMQKYRGKL